jgi:uncharacterized protein (UPF0335 family)
MADGEIGGNAAAVLKGFVGRVDRLMDERKGINDDIAEVIKEAKANGFDGPAVRRAVRMYRMEKAKRDEMIAIDEAYLAVLGLL